MAEEAVVEVSTTQAELPLDPAAVLPRRAPEVAELAEKTATPPEETKVVEEPESAESIAKRDAMRARRKLDKAYRSKAEAEGRAEAYRKELDSLRQPAKVEGEPTLAQFDYDPEKYATAKAEFAKTQQQKDLQAQSQQQASKQYREQLASKWEDKVDRAEGKYPDWAEVVGELTPDTSFTAAIMDCDNAEDVAYHLGKNPAEAERIAKLSPLSQVREIGRLEEKLLATPPKAKTPSKAPAPIAPLSGTAPVVSDKPLASDDDKTWIEKRRRQVRGR